MCVFVLRAMASFDDDASCQHLFENFDERQFAERDVDSFHLPDNVSPRQEQHHDILVGLLRIIQAELDVVKQRLTVIEVARNVVEQHHAPSNAWICPVCLEPMKHMRSFKGHIKRLFLFQCEDEGSHAGKRNPACCMQLTNRHKNLVGRQNGATHYIRSRQFATQLWEQVSVCIILYTFLYNSLAGPVSHFQ
jgi:hypothetical protein